MTTCRKEAKVSTGKLAPIFAAVVTLALGLAAAFPANAAGDLSRQTPIELTVELGNRGGAHGFFPNKLRFETGKLYKLVLYNSSKAPHYFTSHDFTQRIFTRKVQVIRRDGDKAATLA
jgi:uncharacterized cupredoxin-like copper-binding protein